MTKIKLYGEYTEKYLAKPHFTKKHYEAMGKMIDEILNRYLHGHFELVEIVIKHLKKDNPKFSEDKFRSSRLTK